MRERERDREKGERDGVGVGVGLGGGGLGREETKIRGHSSAVTQFTPKRSVCAMRVNSQRHDGAGC